MNTIYNEQQILNKVKLVLLFNTLKGHFRPIRLLHHPYQQRLLSSCASILVNEGKEEIEENTPKSIKFMNERY